MARKQGPEEKYYPKVWRFLRRCISPLKPPREGNTFASRNGLSNRFSHMDQPQSLRHRFEPGFKGDIGMRSTPIATGRKEPREAERGLAQRRKKMPLPFQGAGQGTDPQIHRQVRKVDRESGAQEPIWWERTPGCRVSCRISALRIILGSKEKDSSARPAASVNVYTISATSSAL